MDSVTLSETDRSRRSASGSPPCAAALQFACLAAELTNVGAVGKLGHDVSS